MKEKIIKISNENKNLVISGNISSGKTTNILFPLVEQILDKKESFLVLDSKEEYINNYYEKLKKANYNIITINLRNPKESDGWNPLNYAYHLYKSDNIDEALDCLETIGKDLLYEKSSSDPFWSNSASDIFNASVLGLFNDATEEEINLNSVMSILENFETKLGDSSYSNIYFSNKDINSDIYKYAHATISAPSETKGGILSVAKQKLRLYTSRENLTSMLKKTTFNYKDIINKPTAIFIINFDEKTTYSRLALMFINEIYSMLLVNNKQNFNFILDNFDTLDYFPELKNILSSCIARKIKVFIATRSVKDVISNYSEYLEKLANGIIINRNNIEIYFDGEKEIIEKDFQEINIDKVNIDYPKLNNSQVKIFSLIDKVNNDKKTRRIKITDDKISVEEILKKIDEKIKELENEK